MPLRISNTLKCASVAHWSFVEKTSVMRETQTQNEFKKKQMEMYSPVEASGGQEQYYIRSS